MVKCLNAGPGGRVVNKWRIVDARGNPPSTRCPKFLRADYERVDELDPRTRQRITEFVCPECGTGPRVLYAKEVAEFQKDERALRKLHEERLFQAELARIPSTIRRGTKEYKKEEAKIKFRAKRQVFGEEEAQKWLREEEETRAQIKGLAIPTTPFTKYIKQVLPSVYFAVGGLVVSGLLGSPWFFFAALAFGLSVILPSPESIKAIHDRAEGIKRAYESSIKDARRRKASAEEIRNLIEGMKAEVELETLLAEADKEKNVIGLGKATGIILAKESLKMVGFLILIVSLLINRVIPFAGLVGLIIGFVAYFSISAERKPKEEE